MNEADHLAEMIHRVDFDDVPDDAVERAKVSVRDLVGVAIYGSQNDIGETVQRYVRGIPRAEASQIWGCDLSCDPLNAAFANGVFGHASDFDDTFEDVSLHPSAPVVPALFALAEEYDKNGRQLITSYTVGVETLYRIGKSVDPAHQGIGWHSTGTIGVFGAAAAAAALLDLSVDEIKYALGIAASSSAGLRAQRGTMSKPYHAGNAAKQGVQSALLAKSGFTSNQDIFGCENGYGDAYTRGSSQGGYEPAHITEDAEPAQGVSNIGIKPFPSGAATHAAMESLRKIVLENDLSPDDIQRITVTVDEWYSSNILSIQEPADALEGKFSYEYCLAITLLETNPGIQDFTDERVNDDQVKEQMVKVRRNPASDLYPDVGKERSRGAKVAVTATDDSEFEHEEKTAPGMPSNPVSNERLEDKFLECAESRYSRSKAEEISSLVMDLENVNEISTVTELFEG